MNAFAHALAQLEIAYAAFLEHGLAKTSKTMRDRLETGMIDFRADFELDAAVLFFELIASCTKVANRVEFVPFVEPVADVAGSPSKPVTLRDRSFPARGANAPCTLVLRSRGGDAHCPYMTHWRNDTSGGFSHGEYFETLAEATESFEHREARELRFQEEFKQALSELETWSKAYLNLIENWYGVDVATHAAELCEDYYTASLTPFDAANSYAIDFGSSAA